MKTANKLLLGTAIALAGAGAMSSDAFARTVIYANVEPPALRVETVPAPRAGLCVGQWPLGLVHHKYAWHDGHWVRERHGYNYAPARWERDGDRWRYYDGVGNTDPTRKRNARQSAGVSFVKM